MIEDIKQLALRWIQDNINQWPAHAWYTLTRHYDMELYIDVVGEQRATIYHVRNGKIDNDKSIGII